jgi:hypothetical protein
VIAITARPAERPHNARAGPHQGRREGKAMRALDTLNTAAGAITRRAGPAASRALLGHTLSQRILQCILMLMIFGPYLLLVDWQNRSRADEILRRGVTVEANVTGTEVIRGKSTSYAIDLAWRDAQGAQQRVAQVRVSAEYFEQITRAPSANVRIKYLADRELSRRTVGALDDPSWRRAATRTISSSLVSTLLGLSVVAVMILLPRRRHAGAA